MDRDRMRQAWLNASSQAWYRIENKADDGPPEVFIYDVIDSWMGVSAEAFARDLAALDSSEVVVRINSPGGDVFDGIAIMNSLRGHKAKVTTVVDGIAASAASFIAMAGDEIVMRPNSEMMIHDASGLVIGNASDMRDFAKELDRVSNNIASMYADRTGESVDTWRKAMGKETWYSAQEAVDAGLADRVEAKSDTADDAAKAKARFDLSIFNYAGRSHAPAPKATPAAEAGATGKEGMMPTLKESLAERFGFDPTSDDDTAIAAVDEALKEQADTEGGGKDEPKPVQLPDGVVAIDAGTLEELKALAKRGDDARRAQERNERVDAVENAIRTGRLSPSQRQKWTDRLEKDPSEIEVLNSLPAVFPVGQEIGGAGGVEGAADDVYAALFGQEA